MTPRQLAKVINYIEPDNINVLQKLPNTFRT